MSCTGKDRRNILCLARNNREELFAQNFSHVIEGLLVYQSGYRSLGVLSDVEACPEIPQSTVR